ncbi:MAG TPA: GntR family transcriptional regulator [Atribacteraceae bacterium]|nr:GntR family transcriptional regulator [Atribacteraceae bacterium]
MNRESQVQAPLYIKISEALKKEISDGTYEAGDFLPTEDELEERFSASRTTIRNAVGKLERDGLVFRKQGKGTIVQEPKPIQNLNLITSFTETLREKGVTVETGNLSLDLITPPLRIVHLLSLKNGEKTYLVQRIRIADGVPIAFMSNYLVARLVPGMENKKNALRLMGLYQLLEEEYELELARASETIESYISGPLEADLLHLTDKTALFHTVRITYLADGTPFEVVVSVIRADRYEYRVYLEKRPKH